MIIIIIVIIIIDRPIGLVDRVFVNGPENWDLIPGGVIPDSKNGTWYLLT